MLKKNNNYYFTLYLYELYFYHANKLNRLKFEKR